MDGAAPVGVDIAADGRLFGCTEHGGINDLGTLFLSDVTLGSVQPILHLAVTSTHSTLGFHPPASVILAPDGRLYGVTRLGGEASKGSVFRLSTAPLCLTPNAFHVAGTCGQHHSLQGTLQNHLRKP